MDFDKINNMVVKVAKKSGFKVILIKFYKR